MDIQGNVFVVTGGASGLGAATARMLVAQGAQVVLADVNTQAGQALAAELGAAARFVLTDVTDEASARHTFDVAQSLGPLRGLVNCAGIAPAEKVVGKQGAHKLETFSRTIQINLIGSFNMLRLAAERMVASEPAPCGDRGIIINTASVAAYAASKGGIVAMTLPVARELARSAVRVLTIAPGIMETPMLLGMPAEVQDALGKMVPYPSRLGRPAEYAALAEHLIRNQYLNGEVIRLDGAIRLAAK